MGLSKTQEVVNEAKDLLTNNYQEARYSQLLKEIQARLPSINRGTIKNVIIELESLSKGSIVKVERGLFKLAIDQSVKTKETKRSLPNEAAFYEPFADWLVYDLEECTHAIRLGGSRLKDKWGTPDVIGIRESKKSDIVQWPIEIISAEIKTDTNNIIQAFGQACSYKIFCHKVYMVIPKQSFQEDISRVDTLCRIFGIGLVLFDASNFSNPAFEIRGRASKHEPDMFYVNKYIKLIEDDLFGRRTR